MSQTMVKKNLANEIQIEVKPIKKVISTYFTKTQIQNTNNCFLQIFGSVLFLSFSIQDNNCILILKNNVKKLNNLPIHTKISLEQLIESDIFVLNNYSIFYLDKNQINIEPIFWQYLLSDNFIRTCFKQEPLSHLSRNNILSLSNVTKLAYKTLKRTDFIRAQYLVLRSGTLFTKGLFVSAYATGENYKDETEYTIFQNHEKDQNKPIEDDSIIYYEISMSQLALFYKVLKSVKKNEKVDLVFFTDTLILRVYEDDTISRIFTFKIKLGNEPKEEFQSIPESFTFDNSSEASLEDLNSEQLKKYQKLKKIMGQTTKIKIYKLNVGYSFFFKSTNFSSNYLIN